jgi:hypothetical protein
MEIFMQTRDWANEAEAIAAAALEWTHRLQSKPFINNNGMSPDTAFYLYYWVREIAPKLIVESGTWRGFSTWAMRQAAPEAKIVSLDPIFALGYCIDPAKLGTVYWPADLERLGNDFPAPASSSLPNRSRHWFCLTTTRIKFFVCNRRSKRVFNTSFSTITCPARRRI